MDRWKGDRCGADLTRWLVETLKGEIVVELCKYMRAFTYLKRSGIRAGCVKGGESGETGSQGWDNSM